MPTQLSATPPARQRFFMPVSLCTWRAMRSMISSVTTCTDAARSISRCVSRRLGLARRAAEQLVEGAVRHGEAVEVVEVRPCSA